MTKSPPRTPSAMPALTATSEPPLEDEDEDVDVDVAEASDADAAVVDVLTAVEEANELDDEEAEVAATKDPSISSAVEAVEASMAVGNTEDEVEAEEVCSATFLLMPFALFSPASDEVVFVASLVLSVDDEEGKSVVNSPPAHPDDVSVV